MVFIRPPAVLSDERIASMSRAHAEQAEAAWTPFWEYGCYIHVEDLARATVCALTCPDPGHELLLVVAEDISSRAMSSQEWSEHVLSYVLWHGGAEYDVDYYCALVDSGHAQRVLGWKPRYIGTVRPSARLHPALY